MNVEQWKERGEADELWDGIKQYKDTKAAGSQARMTVDNEGAVQGDRTAEASRRGVASERTQGEIWGKK